MVLILLASQGSNLTLAENLQQHLTKLDCPAEIVDLVELNLPLYSGKAEQEGVPEIAVELTTRIAEAKALVVVSPEYNGSIPPVFSNSLAWVSRSGGSNWREAFTGKWAALATHSGGGGQKVLQAIRGQLEHLGCNCLARTLLTYPSKPLREESAIAVMEELVSFIP